MYPLYSTTTCQNFAPRVTKNTATGIAQPDSNDKPFQFASSTCVTVNSREYGGFLASTSVNVEATSTANFDTTTISDALNSYVPYFGISIFFLVVIFWVWIFQQMRR